MSDTAETKSEYRHRLKPFVNTRVEFTGQVKAHGNGNAGNGNIKHTVLLHSVKYNGERVASHVWINSELSDLSKIDVGQTIRFSAVVRPYASGFKKKKEDENNRIKYGYHLAGVVLSS